MRVKITEAPRDGQHAQPGEGEAAEQLQHGAHDIVTTGVADEEGVQVGAAEGSGGDSVSMEISPQADRKHWLGAEPKTPPLKIRLGEGNTSLHTSAEGTSSPREGEGQAFSPVHVADTVSNGIDWGKGIIENGISGLMGAGASIVGGLQRSMSPDGSGSSYSARLDLGGGEVQRVRKRGSLLGMEVGGEQPSKEVESMIPENMIGSNAIIGTSTGEPGGICVPLQGGGGAAVFPAVEKQGSDVESAAAAPGSAFDRVLQQGEGAGTTYKDFMEIGGLGESKQRDEGWQVHALSASKTTAGGKNAGDGGGGGARVDRMRDFECPMSLVDAGRSASLPVENVAAGESAEATANTKAATFFPDLSKSSDEGKATSEATEGGGRLLARIGEEKDEDCIQPEMRERQLSWPSMDRKMWRQASFKTLTPTLRRICIQKKSGDGRVSKSKSYTGPNRSHLPKSW